MLALFSPALLGIKLSDEDNIKALGISSNVNCITFQGGILRFYSAMNYFLCISLVSFV